MISTHLCIAAYSTDEALDRVGRKRRNYLGLEEAGAIQKSLSYDLLDPDFLNEAQQMSVVYAAIHAFENTVRGMVTKAMAEEFGEAWWEKVPERIRKTSKNRIEEGFEVPLARSARCKRDQLL